MLDESTQKGTYVCRYTFSVLLTYVHIYICQDLMYVAILHRSRIMTIGLRVDGLFTQSMRSSMQYLGQKLLKSVWLDRQVCSKHV